MQTAHYGTLVIRPRSMQFAIDELPLLLLCLAGYGVEYRTNLVGHIRERVETNKQRKGIYEITNR